MINIQRTSDGIDEEIDRLAEGPSIKDIIELERVLAQQFQATQNAVHVQTGSLKTSGKVSSGKGPSSWHGEIAYGGISGGIHNPVDYAEFERERDGVHDFLEPAKKIETEYTDAIDKFLRG